MVLKKVKKNKKQLFKSIGPLQDRFFNGPNGPGEEIMYQYVEDPGHSWLRVSIKEVDDLHILDDITGFSFIHSRYGVVFLEEDLDMQRFLEAKRNINDPVDLKNIDYRWVWDFPRLYHPDIIQGHYIKFTFLYERIVFYPIPASSEKNFTPITWIV